MKIKRYILAADMHYPQHDKKAWKALKEFISDIKPDGFVFMGDQLDMKNISHHEKGKPRKKATGGYKKDLDGFYNEILNPLDLQLGTKCDKRFIHGNHEAWLQILYDEQPELEGALDIEDHLDLHNMGWKVIDLGKMTNIGKLHVLHGENFNGANAAKKLVETLCQSAVMGHIHTAQSYTKTAPVNKKKWTGTVLPTMGTVDAEYAKKRPNANLHGFGVVELWGRNFNLYTVVITNGQFAFGGKIYGGKR